MPLSLEPGPCTKVDLWSKLLSVSMLGPGIKVILQRYITAFRSRHPYSVQPAQPAMARSFEDRQGMARAMAMIIAPASI